MINITDTEVFKNITSLTTTKPSFEDIDIEEAFSDSGAPVKKEIQPMKKFGVPYSLEKAEFENCFQSNEVINFLKGWSLKCYGNVLLSGNSGSGKSYLCACCIDAYRKIDRNYAYYWNISDLYIHWRLQDKQENKDIQLLKELAALQLLVLDDIGTRTPTDAFLEFLYMLINHRDHPRKGTLITTNLTSQQMIDRLGNPLMSRFCSGKIFVIQGKDRRINKTLCK